MKVTGSVLIHSTDSSAMAADLTSRQTKCNASLLGRFI